MSELSGVLALVAQQAQIVAAMDARLRALEEQMANLSEPVEYDDEEAAQTYMDGTPVL